MKWKFTLCLPVFYFWLKNWMGIEDKAKETLRTEDKLYFQGGWESQEEPVEDTR